MTPCQILHTVKRSQRHIINISMPIDGSDDLDKFPERRQFPALTQGWPCIRG